MIDNSIIQTTNSWPFAEARKLVKERQKIYEKKGKIILQTGYGPSGLPHIGTFAEVARTTMMVNAIKQITDVPSEIITFSDDMDGLRKIPDNIPNKETAFIYNGMCLFEGTNLSEGRGTEHPFKIIGAPWVDSSNLMSYIKYLKDAKYGDKVIIKELQFIPVSNQGAKNPKYENQTCYGIFIEYLDKSIEPIDLAIDLLDYFNNYDDFSFKDSFFDTLYGSSDLRLSITNIDNLDKIISNIKEDVIEFNKVREKYLLY